MDTEIFLYPPGGGPNEANTSPFGDKLDHQLKQIGEYTVIVQDYALNDAGSYNITFLKIPGTVSYPGDQDGGNIASGETASGNIVASDMDAFKFMGTAGERVIVTATRISGSLDTELYLYPPNGGPLEADTSPFGDKLDHQLNQTGEYTVIVHDYSLNNPGSYNLTFLKIPGAASFPADPDGGNIASGETASGSIIASDMDAFKFYGETGERVIITAARISGSLDTELYLYPPDGSPLEADSSPFGDKLDHQLRKTGVYTVIVHDYALNNPGSYNLTFLKIPGAVSSLRDLDGGDLVSSGTASGRIITSDMDAYQFYGRAGDRVIITAARASGSLDTELYLYPPDGGPLEASTSPFGDRLDHQLQKTGLYTTIVHDYALNDAGEYNITLIKIPADLRPGIYNPSPKSETTIVSISNSFGWDRVEGAIGYDLYFGFNIVAPLAKIGVNLPSPSMPFPTTATRQVYYWRVVAHTPSGDIKGPYWWFLDCGRALTAPSALTANGISETQINLKWQDNSDNETGFEIERKIGTGSFGQVATVAANETTFADTGLIPSATYTYRVRAINSNDSLCTYSDYSNESNPITTSVNESADEVPLTFELGQNYPNPFNPTTNIEYSLPRPSQVTLKVFNLLGEEVATLVDQKLAAGRYKAHWDVSGLESGVYFYQLQAGTFVQTKKLLLLK